MFAYCGNNPVSNADPSGQISDVAINPFKQFDNMDGLGAGAGGAGIPIAIDLPELAAGLIGGILYSVSWVYRQYARGIKSSTSSLQPGNYPVVHHIVPYGEYSNRDTAVAAKLAEAQQIMRNAGVNPRSDLFNQVVISATYHQSLHTNDYLLMVTTPIAALGPNATKEQIYTVLFWLRIGIAANDPGSYGY